jgi:predicted ArsR family transcriptional regulator
VELAREHVDLIRTAERLLAALRARSEEGGALAREIAEEQGVAINQVLVGLQFLEHVGLVHHRERTNGEDRASTWHLTGAGVRLLDAAERPANAP